MTHEEEANWWETHNTADYFDEFDQIEMQVAPGAFKVPKKLRELSRKLVASNLDSAVRVRLTNQDHQGLKILSTQKGVGMGTLVRMWIREKLRTEGHQIKAT